MGGLTYVGFSTAIGADKSSIDRQGVSGGGSKKILVSYAMMISSCLISLMAVASVRFTVSLRVMVYKRRRRGCWDNLQLAKTFSF